MSKKYAILTFGIALLFALNVSAATGENSSNGRTCNNSSTMANHMNHMTTHSSKSTKMMNSETAQTKMKMYMDHESAAGYEIKNFKDDGSHYRADVVNSDGTLMNRIVVNKKTGNVYFTEK